MFFALLFIYPKNIILVPKSLELFSGEYNFSFVDKGDIVAFSLGWPQCFYVPRNGLQFLLLLPVPPEPWGCNSIPTYVVYVVLVEEPRTSAC